MGWDGIQGLPVFDELLVPPQLSFYVFSSSPYPLLFFPSLPFLLWLERVNQ